MKKLTKYLVGGAVRDKLLGLAPKDRDYVVVGTTSEEMIAQGFQQVGKEFPVFIDPIKKEEYALARTEKKSGKGYKGFTFNSSPQITLEEDLVRRDLTINGIAYDQENDRYIAPHSGLDDIKKKILRHISSHFEEDPLRVLRVARFQAQFPQFSIAPETKALMQKMSSTLNELSPQRVFIELQKALLTTTPSLFFITLERCGALTTVFPELAALKSIPQPPEYHPEGDAWTHTLLTLDYAAQSSKDLSIRFAALVHDLGKAQTPPAILPHHTGHEERGIQLIDQLCQRLFTPNKIKEFAKLVTRHHFQAHQSLELTNKQLLQLLKACNALQNDSTTFENFLTCCIADNRGKKSSNYPQAIFLQNCAKKLRELDFSAITTKFSGKKIANEIEKIQLQTLDHLLNQG